MPTLEELLKKYNIDAGAGPQSGPKGKLLAQADKMLRVLKDYKSADELDGDATKYWWSPKSIDGRRRVTARYSGMVVEGFACYVDNTVEAVRAQIEIFRKLIEDSDDNTWAHEEERRSKK